MNKWIFSIFIFVLLVTLGVFQNCQKMDFAEKAVETSNSEPAQSDTTSNSESSSDSSGDGNVTQDESSNDDEDEVTITPPPPSLEVEFECETFESIDSDLVDLPTRTGNICYYVKLMDAVPSHSSGNNGEARDSEVLASDHNGRSSTYISPYSMADKTLEIHSLANWKVAISGSYNNTDASMAIDNFFLINVDTNTKSLVWGFGTKDAEPGSGNQPILVKGQPLENYTHFQDGGTAVVTAINVTPSLGDSESMKFRFRGLDCGASAQATDVYLVFH